MPVPSRSGETPSPDQSARMRDVAQLAGVSHMTVSRVLNENGNVRPQTRARVLEAVRQLGYRPNSAARTLATRRSNTVGIVALDTTLYGPTSMVFGIERAARAAGFFVSVATITAPTRRSLLGAVRHLEEQRVEGLVAIVPRDAGATVLRSIDPSLPVVAIGNIDVENVSSVGVDNVAGAFLVTQHLLSLGHETVHHVAGPPGWREATERTEGWREALQSAGAPVPLRRIGDWSPRSGYAVGRDLAADRDVTAIFCANDHMAIGVLRALSEAGRRVPDDVSVAGFDDIPEAGFLIPPLSTVRQDFAALGHHCLRVLRELASQPGVDQPIRVMLKPELQVRGSCAPP